ncbi:MAG: hypothetical protein WCI22_04640 [Actinomycetota bacterium]
MKLADCGRSLVRNWKIVLLVALVCAAGSYLVSTREAAHYESAGRLVLGLSPELTAPQNGQALNNIGNRQLIATFAEVAGSQAVFTQSVVAVGVGAEASSYTLTTARLPEANGIEVRVNGPSATVAQSLAAKAMTLGSTKFLTLYPDYVVSTVQAPVPSTTAVSPKPKKLALIALALGLILGFLVGLVVDRIRGYDRGATPDSSPIAPTPA